MVSVRAAIINGAGPHVFTAIGIRFTKTGISKNPPDNISLVSYKIFFFILMIPGIYLHLITTAFQKDENEDNEITNEGMYGKKLCAYLMQKLQALGYDVPSFWNEDWGWWIEIKGTAGLCVYNGPSDGDQITEYVVVSSEENARRWSWRHFRRIQDSKKQENIRKLMEDLENICNSDPQFTSVKRMSEMPW